MSMPSDVTIATAASSGADHSSYVDWPAVIAGIVLASAISLVLMTFGAAIGLSFTNFRSPTGVNPVWIAIAGATWLLWVQVSSFMAGGYLTGRMRRRFHDATEHESDVRDGAHGLLVWAGALVVGAIIAVSGIGAAVNAVSTVAGTAVTAASNVAEDAAPLDPNAYFVDTLFRTDQVVQGADGRGEATRILMTSATGPLADADKAYLATLVARDTGLPPADAQARVDQVLAQVEDAKAKAAAAAETARKTTILAAFLTAAAFLVAAAGAYWAASMGGRHRDEGTVFATIFTRY